MAKEQTRTEQSQPTNKSDQARIYKGQQVLDHDLFKLLPAKMIKNAGYDKDNPIITEILHEHFFHTIDSDGVIQHTSTPTGGHFHSITVKRTKGVPEIVVSPPMHYVGKVVKGKKQTVAVPIPIVGEFADEHTHDVEYHGSEKIQMRVANIEYAKAEAAMAASEIRSVPGVTAG